MVTAMANGTRRDAISEDRSKTTTFARWCESTGYNPKTRTYKRSARDNAPRAVPGAHTDVNRSAAANRRRTRVK